MTYDHKRYWICPERIIAHSSAVMLAILMHDCVMHDKWLVGAGDLVGHQSKASRSSMYQHEQCVLDALLLLYRVISTIISLFFLGQELNLHKKNSAR